MSGRMTLPQDTNGRWSRPGVDSHGLDFIITTVKGENYKTRVVRSFPVKNGKGQPVTSPAAVRRALAHHYGRYKGSMECKMCHGKEEFELNGTMVTCRFCRIGIPKSVCGDCNEPLPGCACLRRVGRSS